MVLGGLVKTVLTTHSSLDTCRGLHRPNPSLSSLKSPRGLPAAFLHHVMPFVTQLAGRTESQPLPGRLPRSRPWALQHRSTVHTVPAAVFAGTEQALPALARDNPEACSTVLHDLRNAENYHLRFLTCRAVAAIDDPDDAICWLLSDTRNLALGWADSSNWASRELIERHSGDCSPDVFEKLQAALLDYTPPWDDRPFRGRDRYELMSALDRTRLSPLARRKLQELERRFKTAPAYAAKTSQGLPGHVTDRRRILEAHVRRRLDTRPSRSMPEPRHAGFRATVQLEVKLNSPSR